LEILNLRNKIRVYNDIMAGLAALVMDTAACTDPDTLTPREREEFASLSPDEAISALRRPMQAIVDVGATMADRYTNAFAEKAVSMSNELAALEREIESLRTERQVVSENNASLSRFADILAAEKQSLAAIAQNLQQQISRCGSEQELELARLQNEMLRLADESSEINSKSALAAKRSDDLKSVVQAPMTKRLRDYINEDVALSAKIPKLEALQQRQIEEHDLLREELRHTKREIARAKEVVLKFKNAHRPEEKETAERVNKRLRVDIDNQRVDMSRAVQNQIKKNQILEKQKADLVEEEILLKQYLAVVEKKLAAQIEKLPTLAQIQHRGEPESVLRKAKKARKRRPAREDAELRGISRVMTNFQKDQKRAESSLVR
jgi:hypothetical protein